MKTPSHATAFKVLLLQAADEGRGATLFGDSLTRAYDAASPFLIGSFPSVYLEHPLAGDPFLDVTLLLRDLERGMRVASPAAGDHGAMIDWFANAEKADDDISCGFELDTKNAELPMAAVHFQPRSHLELVQPFCETIGEPQRAKLYLDLAQRMPDGWPLSFFGLFRGRADSPLRVCGYMGDAEKQACAQDPNHLAAAFDEIGFGAYDAKMLSQAAELMAATPGAVDFQLDVFPDASLGATFAIDMQFGIEQPEAVQKTFSEGPGARVMGLLQDWGAADDRWRAAVQSAFARAIPVQLDDGDVGRFAFTLMPQWAKARWINGELQIAKLYHFANAQLLGGQASGRPR